MIEALLADPKAWVFMILAAVITIALAAIAVVVVVLLRKLLKKIGVEEKDTTSIIESAKALIKTVVMYFNQTIVDNLKKNNGGSLTEDQKNEVYNKVLTQVTNILSNEQLEAIIKTYGGEDADMGLKILIESTVAEVKSENNK